MRNKLTAAITALLTLFGMTGTALANPSSFGTATSTADATTTLRYMTPGTATTTTPVYDSYAQTFAGAPYKADYAGLLVLFQASSSASVLNANIEYSQDGIDWFRNFVIDPNQIATSTGPAFLVGSPFSFSWKFASSTIGGVAYTNVDQATAALLAPTPFRYTRVVFTMTGARGAIWASLLPIKQVR